MNKVKELKLESFAKINLSLDVTGTRPDGYHTVKTVMQQIGLFDNISIRWEERPGEGKTIKISTNRPYIPTDERNIAYKAAALMMEEAGEGLSDGALEIRIEKHIPVAAGLGGGSSNGAGVLVGLNELWELKKDTKELCRLGSLLGADVPFCVLAQNTHYTCALGEGIGDVLTPIKQGMRKHLVVAKPPFGVSTREVFSQIDDCLIEERPDTEALIEGLKKSNYEEIYKNMVNVLENYTLNRYDRVAKLKDEIKKAKGVKKVLMTGSGPTVMGIFDRYKEAKTACLAMRAMGYEAYWVTTGKGRTGERND